VVDIIGEVFLFVVALLLSGLFLLVIPETLGIKAGFWVARNHFQSEPQIKVGETSWWTIFICIIAVETIIINIAALGGAIIPSERPFFPVFIYKALLEQQLQDPAYVILYSILMISAFFIAGFVRVLRGRKQQIKNTDQA
jgi:hypothetical protein